MVGNAEVFDSCVHQNPVRLQNNVLNSRECQLFEYHGFFVITEVAEQCFEFKKGWDTALGANAECGKAHTLSKTLTPSG